MDIDDFCKGLQKNKIQLVADLRKNPVSRKRGFSKNKLAEALQKYKIEYEHLGNLGVPSEWRKKAKAEIITRKKMFRDYVKKIIPQAADEIERIRKQMKKQKLALLCYESDASDCHRSFVAQELKSREPKLIVKDIDLDAGRPQLFTSVASRARSKAPAK